MKDAFSFRVRFVYGTFLLAALVVITRLFFLQVVYGNYYKDEANKQYKLSPGNTLDRGEISFKDKDGKLFSAASIKTGYFISLVPYKIKDAQDVYSKLSSIVDIDKDQFFKMAGKKEDTYEELIHKLEKEQADKIKELKLEGVIVNSEAWRFYPGDNLASQVVGFMGFSGHDYNGRSGLERFYEDVLHREASSPQFNSFAEVFADIKKSVSSGGAGVGDIVTTIDPIVQTMLEKELDGLLIKYKPKLVGAIIMEPKTGKILAMSSKPDFNPNEYGKTENISYFNNPAVESVFEMGSIMKPLTLAGAMDIGAITATTKYEDKGFIEVNKKRIENFDGKTRGWVDMQEVLNQSLNTGAAFVALKMGKDNFKKYVTDYGLGEKTGIDLPAEVNGKIANLNTSRDIEYITAAYGQGIAVTPIEMITAVSSLANGGVLMKPHIVQEIIYNGDIEVRKEIPNEEKRRVLKKETTEEMSRMLVEVVDTALVNGKYKMDRYSIAAKTGTAQQRSGAHEGYDENNYLHTLFGYAPAFDAKFTILFYMKSPSGIEYAAYSLSEPFMNMTKFLINHYEIAPDR